MLNWREIGECSVNLVLIVLSCGVVVANTIWLLCADVRVVLGWVCKTEKYLLREVWVCVAPVDATTGPSLVL